MCGLVKTRGNDNTGRSRLSYAIVVASGPPAAQSTKHGDPSAKGAPNSTACRQASPAFKL